MASFFHTQLRKHQNSQFWLFQLFRFIPVFAADFEKSTSYFSTSNPAFSRDYNHRIELTFFKSKLASQRSASALSTMSFFSATGSRSKQITSNYLNLIIIHSSFHYVSTTSLKATNSKQANMLFIQD